MRQYYLLKLANLSIKTQTNDSEARWFIFQMILLFFYVFCELQPASSGLPNGIPWRLEPSFTNGKNAKNKT